MARKVFYSFHYERDAWRAAQVRNSNTIADSDEFGVIDGVEWEKIERSGDDAIKRWIKSQLEYTSVTVVLIGAETADRKWVVHEIKESWNRGNALLGIRVHNMKNQKKEIDSVGINPLDQIRFQDGTAVSSVCKTYDWVLDDGRTNMSDWVEQAFKDRANLKGDEKTIEGSANLAKSYVVRQDPKPAPILIQNPPQPWAVGLAAIGLLFATYISGLIGRS